MVKFQRRTGDRYSKLGKGRKKKQKWRKPTGRDNKMREKRKGYPVVVKIGYKKREKESALIISNIKDFENVKKGQVLIIGKVGKRKKIEIAKKAKELKIKIKNLNTKKFLSKIDKKKKEDKEKTEKKVKVKKEIKKSKSEGKLEEKSNLKGGTK